MEPAKRARNILVISRDPNLAEITVRAVDTDVQVRSASDSSEGLNIIQDMRPEIVILGSLESREAVVKLYRNLQEGWISHHASLLVVEYNENKNAYRILSDESLSVEIGEYSLLKGATGNRRRTGHKFVSQRAFQKCQRRALGPKVTARELPISV